MSFPQTRLRRLRRTAGLRDLVRETELSPARLVLPLFVSSQASGSEPIPSMPGVARLSIGQAVQEAAEAAELGLPAVLLFGIPDHKDAEASGAWDEEGVVQLATRAIKEAHPDLLVITDVCVCEYTDHGHCGVLDARGDVDNDATIELYGRVAAAQATAGADVVAPSGMMDGQVGAIRAALDDSGFPQVAILAYAAKYASALYGPFRDAVDVAIAVGGDRRGYQQDPRNAREALAEVLLDVDEGADMVMVKPALAYLDVIARVRAAVEVPVAAYHVSGEYAMVKAAAERGWIDGTAVAVEHVTAIKRAGADVVLTYLAGELAELLNG
jgi:porphobilinogen synthase